MTLRILHLVIGIMFSALTAFAQSAEYTMMHQGNRAFRRGEWAKAEQFYRKALESNPRSGRAAFNLGDAFLAQKNGKDALDCYVKAAKIETNKTVKAMAYHNIGYIHHNNKDYDKAIESYKEALRNNPRDEDTRYNLALAQKQRKQQNDNQQKQDNKNDSNSGSNQQKDENQDSQPQQNQPQMQDDNVEQLLNLANQSEKETRQKLEKMQQPRRKQLEKNW